MKSLAVTVLAFALGAGVAAPASADQHRCSTKALAGQWIFATGIGHQMLGGPFPPNKDITAIGKLTFERDGSINGRFDVTIEEFAFLPDNTVEGTIIVYPDCTGYLTFVTSAGTARTDSIAVVGPREILGMTQDPNNLWTYQVRKISGKRSHRDDD